MRRLLLGRHGVDLELSLEHLQLPPLLFLGLFLDQLRPRDDLWLSLLPLLRIRILLLVLLLIWLGTLV